LERTSCGTGLHCPVPSLFRRISRAPSASPLAKRASPHLPWCFSAFLHPCKGRLELFESKMLPSVARSACSWPHSDILDSVEAASAHGKRVRQPKSGTTRSLTWTPRQIQVPSLVQIAGLGQRGRAHRPWHAISTPFLDRVASTRTTQTGVPMSGSQFLAPFKARLRRGVAAAVRSLAQFLELSKSFSDVAFAARERELLRDQKLAERPLGRKASPVSGFLSASMDHFPTTVAEERA